MTDLPHDPYIDAVIEALDKQGLCPHDWWTSDSEDNPYGDGPTTMLKAVLTWPGDATGVNTFLWPHGLIFVWEHPAEQWQYAALRDNGNDEPKPIPALGRFAAPESVVAVFRALAACYPVPEGNAPYWHPADAVRDDITAWEQS